jgi:hypothetical protein
MRDTERAFHPGRFRPLGQIRDPTRRAQALQALTYHGQTRRVVAPVLKPAQALDQDGDDIAAGGRADNSAHVMAPRLGEESFRRRSIENEHASIVQPSSP